MDRNEFVYRMVAITLAAVLISVIGVMLIGLFDPIVDNAEVFKILGPAFQMVVGVFVGVLASEFKRGPDK